MRLHRVAAAILMLARLALVCGSEREIALR
jgi:hypothetical protein